MTTVRARAATTSPRPAASWPARCRTAPASPSGERAARTVRVAMPVAPHGRAGAWSERGERDGDGWLRGSGWLSFACGAMVLMPACATSSRPAPPASETRDRITASDETGRAEARPRAHGARVGVLRARPDDDGARPGQAGHRRRSALRRGVQPARADLQQPRRRRSGRRELSPRAAAECARRRRDAQLRLVPVPAARYADATAQFSRPWPFRSTAAASRTLLALGVCQAFAGQLAEADATLSRAYEMDPSNPFTGTNLLGGPVPARRVRACALLHPPRQRDAGSRERADLVARGADRAQARQRQGAREFGNQLRNRFPNRARGGRVLTGRLR